MKKLIVTKHKEEIVPLTLQEVEETEIRRQEQEEQGIIDSLIPSEEELSAAEIELRVITILMEVGLI